jgi:DNA helicase-2/ATP-dependent DNA helicase PcrA
VIGLADGRFPHSSAFPGEQWEEERRLLYVAATRARKHLVLTYPRELMSPDRRFKRVGMSPFIAELEPGGYEVVRPALGDAAAAYGTAYKATSGRARPLLKKKEKKAVLDDFSKGCRVNHPFFGTGTVQKKNPPRSLDVAFDRHGMKTLHLDYAKLTIVDG